MLSVYGQTLAAAGQRDEARKVLGQIEQLSANRFVSPYQVAQIYNFLGDKKKALELLEKGYEQREAWMVWLGVEPAFDNLRNEARFIRLLELTENPGFLRAREDEIDKSVTPSTRIMTTDEGDSIPTRETLLPEKRKAFSPRWFAAVAVMVVFIFATAAIAMRYGWQSAWRNSTAAQPATVSEPQIVQSVNAEKAAQSRLRSLAILPFTTIEAKSDDEQYLGVGTADLVTNKLSELREVNLRSAGSVRRYLKSNKSPTEIGRDLAVDFVVSGSVERKDRQVEARLEMVDVANGSVIWAENFAAPNNNLFDLQDDISEKIVNSLSLRLTTQEKQNLTRHFTDNNDAQQLYFAGRYHFGKRTVEGLHQAISLFQQAIEIDPKFALAYTGLADCHGLLNWYQEPPPQDAWANAKAAAAKAVQLDPKIAEAHASLAFIKFHFERDYAGAEDEFRRAVNLKSNYATAHQWYAFLLSAQGRHDESVNIMRRAEELEPRSAVIALAVANVLFYARRYDEAIAQCRRSLEIDPSSVGAYAVLRWNYEKKGMASEALEVYEKELAFAGDTPTSRAKMAHVLAAIGRDGEARRNLDELIKNGQIQHVTPYEIAVIYSLLNQPDKGLEWLKKAKDSHAVGFSFVRVDPMLDNLRQEAHFAEIIK
jgi:TolB-like protein/Flp pilus assembly protein TadD